MDIKRRLSNYFIVSLITEFLIYAPTRFSSRWIQEKTIFTIYFFFIFLYSLTYLSQSINTFFILVYSFIKFI